ncbi:hypothetical protein Rsub_12396 [Raphidocelis subcapitata]|uniref:Uncharacterized protein n=1 Tax=Raphidocelis subcapitata TaxID=307507 RepID=A0A2V0PJ03_9CHLO|nr:hypothetical protein Rsub_12396 [Raphidocelis subcapitata]|eukprot:GBF99768.1 hypothetical protein Rsub_12396 [Raphidocelis subcapitata]
MEVAVQAAAAAISAAAAAGDAALCDLLAHPAPAAAALKRLFVTRSELQRMLAVEAPLADAVIAFRAPSGERRIDLVASLCPSFCGASGFDGGCGGAPAPGDGSAEGLQVLTRLRGDMVPVAGLHDGSVPLLPEWEGAWAEAAERLGRGSGSGGGGGGVEIEGSGRGSGSISSGGGGGGNIERGGLGASLGTVFDVLAVSYRLHLGRLRAAALAGAGGSPAPSAPPTPAKVAEMAALLLSGMEEEEEEEEAVGGAEQAGQLRREEGEGARDAALPLAARPRRGGEVAREVLEPILKLQEGELGRMIGDPMEVRQITNTVLLWQYFALLDQPGVIVPLPRAPVDHSLVVGLQFLKMPPACRVRYTTDWGEFPVLVAYRREPLLYVHREIRDGERGAVFVANNYFQNALSHTWLRRMAARWEEQVLARLGGGRLPLEDTLFAEPPLGSPFLELYVRLAHSPAIFVRYTMPGLEVFSGGGNGDRSGWSVAAKQQGG